MKARTVMGLVGTSVAIAGLAVALLAAAVAFGGPRDIAPLASINDPFAQADFSGVPAPRHFTARDGTRLAWLHYPPAGATPPGDRAARRVVLVHGSSARAFSMHVLARALAAQGLEVAALDMRGHGDSLPRGHVRYIGQLEDDVEDFMRAVPHAGPSTLAGFSAGGGFVLRLAGGSRQHLFDRYLLLAPYLHHEAPVNRPGDGGWVSVGLPRVVALTVLDRLGLTQWQHLPVLRFALNDYARNNLTPSYDFALMSNFRPRPDYRSDIRNAPPTLQVVAGRDDELFDTPRYAAVFTAAAGRPVPVTLLDGVGHVGLTLQPDAVQAVARIAAGAGR